MDRALRNLFDAVTEALRLPQLLDWAYVEQRDHPVRFMVAYTAVCIVLVVMLAGGGALLAEG